LNSVLSGRQVARKHTLVLGRDYRSIVIVILLAMGAWLFFSGGTDPEAHCTPCLTINAWNPVASASLEKVPPK